MGCSFIGFVRITRFTFFRIKPKEVFVKIVHVTLWTAAAVGTPQQPKAVTGLFTPNLNFNVGAATAGLSPQAPTRVGLGPRVPRGQQAGSRVKARVCSF